MEKYIFNNGIKLNYIKREGNLSSFCIGFNAGALVEEENEIGLAHAAEHMLFKGTTKRNEKEINEICDSTFGFHNAMTNYPYVVYYGTTLSSDFEKGFEVYSDIILNPTFMEEGFQEEIDIILEELKEWKDDPYQDCEDELFLNAFNKRRIKELIIGKEEDIKSITMQDIKRFYNKHYAPSDCIITVVSSLDFQEILEIVKKYFEDWEKEYIFKEKALYEANNKGTFNKTRKDLKGSKIQYCFPIDFLKEEEVNLLRIFNVKFGEGTSSILYDEMRTKKGLVYDIGSSLKNEKGIKLFTIKLGASEKNIGKAIDIINENIEKVKTSKEIFTEDNIMNIIKNINLKEELAVERSIEFCKKATTHEIMYNSTYDPMERLNGDIDEDKILKTAKKVLNNPAIQILRPE